MPRTMFMLVLLSIACLGLFSGNVSAANENEAYKQAEACYANLVNHPEKQKFRHNWQGCIDRFKSVYKSNPKGPRGAVSLFMAAQLTEEMYRVSLTANDKKEAIDLYRRTMHRFPKSPFAEKAKAHIAGLRESPKAVSPEAEKPKEAPPVCDPPDAEKQPAENVPSAPASAVAENGLSRVTDLRVWSNPHYTRIAVDLDKETTFSSHLLKQDVSADKPKRLYIDIERCKLGKHIQNFIPINDDLLLDARAGQYTLESVRVVADIKSFETYKIFSLDNPFRIIMDVWGKEPEPQEAPAAVAPETSVKTGSKAAASANVKIAKLKPKDLARQLALGVRRIILDPGHGGKDKGAIGVIPGVYEKDITLAIALKLQKKLKETLGCEVVLTRNCDKYLSLEERTAIANTKNGDLFISIHTNSVPQREAYGIETFFLNLATDDDAVMVAARENATSRKNISDLQNILTELMKNAKITESSRLASIIQENMVRNLSEKYTNIRGKGVKQAPFYVLLGA